MVPVSGSLSFLYQENIFRATVDPLDISYVEAIGRLSAWESFCWRLQKGLELFGAKTENVIILGNFASFSFL